MGTFQYCTDSSSQEMTSGLSIVLIVSLLSILATNPLLLLAALSSETPDQPTEHDSSSESEDTSSINHIPGMILERPVEDIRRTTKSITLPPAIKRFSHDILSPRFNNLLFGKRSDWKYEDRSPTTTLAAPVLSDVQFAEDRYPAVAGACARASILCRDWRQQCSVK